MLGNEVSSVYQNILAFESSCDDTSVAVINTNYQVAALITSSQEEHINFEGILPELASRLHIKNILYLTEQTLLKADMSLSGIDAVAVSINPGLIGSLIVGLSFAKSLSWCLYKPLITVNHMLGHVFANHIEHPEIKSPFLALIVSGGHTELVHFITDTYFVSVGKTLDDAAGETFDKVAKLLNLGFPGGPVIDELASLGDPQFFYFPRALKQKSNFNFSYSGLKTAVLQYCTSKSVDFINSHKADIAASVQMAIVEPLIQKSIRYARENNLNTILLCGGVAANSMLRKTLTEKAESHNITVYYPSFPLCMDNAAMIGAAAIPKLKKKLFSLLDINSFSEKGTRLL